MEFFIRVFCKLREAKRWTNRVERASAETICFRVFCFCFFLASVEKNGQIPPTTNGRRKEKKERILLLLAFPWRAALATRLPRFSVFPRPSLNSSTSHARHCSNSSSWPFYGAHVDERCTAGVVVAAASTSPVLVSSPSRFCLSADLRTRFLVRPLRRGYRRALEDPEDARQVSRD